MTRIDTKKTLAEASDAEVVIEALRRLQGFRAWGDQDLDFEPVDEFVSFVDDDARRLEFGDGSAILAVDGVGWCFGIHRDRLADPRVAEELGGADPRLAWVEEASREYTLPPARQGRRS